MSKKAEAEIAYDLNGFEQQRKQEAADAKKNRECPWLLRPKHLVTKTLPTGQDSLPLMSKGGSSYTRKKRENKNFKIILSGRKVEKRLKFQYKMSLVMFLLIRQTGNFF